MPLTLSTVGEEKTIIKVGGNTEIKKHLNDLGFVPGAEVSVVSELAGNVIVNIKETRVAISRELAQRIMVKNFS